MTLILSFLLFWYNDSKKTFLEEHFERLVEDIRIKKYQKQPPDVFYEKGVLKFLKIKS